MIGDQQTIYFDDCSMLKRIRIRFPFAKSQTLMTNAPIASKPFARRRQHILSWMRSLGGELPSCRQGQKFRATEITIIRSATTVIFFI